ncbi:hypothetical protein D3C73_1623890 [compost metagenome]
MGEHPFVAGTLQASQPFVELDQGLLRLAGEEARPRHHQLATTDQLHGSRDVAPGRGQG